MAEPRDGERVFPGLGLWRLRGLRAVAVWAFIAMVWLGGAGRESTREATTMRLIAARAPGGGWGAPPVPGSTETIHMVVEVEDRAGQGWSTRTVRAMHFNDRPPAGFSWADGYGVAVDMMEAGDPALRVSGGHPVAEQRAVLESLLARAKSSGAAWAAAEPDVEEIRGWLWRWALQRVWLIPLVVLLSVPVIAAVRAARGPTLRGKIAMLRGGTCPTCRYARAGFEVEDPCPECGTTLAGLEREYREVSARRGK